MHMKQGGHKDLDTVDGPGSNAASTKINVEIGRRAGSAKADIGASFASLDFLPVNTVRLGSHTLRYTGSRSQATSNSCTTFPEGKNSLFLMFSNIPSN